MIQSEPAEERRMLWHEWVDIYTAFEWARKFARKIKIRFVFASAHDWLSLFWSNQWLKYIAT